MAARALACQGDAYIGLEKYEEAVAAYNKAAAKADNVFAAAYLLKAGIVYEQLGNKAKAGDKTATCEVTVDVPGHGSGSGGNEDFGNEDQDW